AAHQLADWSDCINDGCARGVRHEALRGSKTPVPEGSLASASRYGFPGSRPVTAASNTCTNPWSDSETLVGAFSAFFAPGGASHSSADWPARPSGCKLLAPRPSGTNIILVIAELRAPLIAGMASGT